MTEGKKLAERLRNWYSNGKYGMETVCQMENAPEQVKRAARNWFEAGKSRLECIANDVEKLGDEKNNK